MTQKGALSKINRACKYGSFTYEEAFKNKSSYWNHIIDELINKFVDADTINNLLIMSKNYKIKFSILTDK